MSPRNLLLFKGIVALLLVWGVAWGLMRWAGAARSSPEKVIAFVREHPLSEVQDEEERKRIIEELARMLNSLEPSEIRELEETAGQNPRRDFFEHMSPAEQLYFLERRVGRAFEQMMQSFNEMDREERRKIVERSLKRMEEGRGAPAGLKETDPEIADKITQAGLKAYYEEANAETKMDLAPLLEEMQRSMSLMRGR
ncbi:MAG: hypothetical protein KDN18_05730 [Verrucomicrobiae bacterium]|nr:hypothetical protein [Verrucomicrobiae bacterium]